MEIDGDSIFFKVLIRNTSKGDVVGQFVRTKAAQTVKDVILNCLNDSSFTIESVKASKFEKCNENAAEVDMDTPCEVLSSFGDRFIHVNVHEVTTNNIRLYLY